MTVQYSTAVRNAMLDSWETTIGVSPKFRLYSGSMPANAAASRTGTLIAEFTLASDWAGNASGGVKTMTLPSSVTAASGGTIGYYSIMDNAGTTCHEQGTAGTSGTDVIVDSTTVTLGQSISITGFSKTAPGA